MEIIKEDDILSSLRAQIDDIDRNIVALLGKRYKVVHEVGQVKSEHGLSPVQPGRIDKVLARVAQLAEEQDLDPEFVKNLYRTMIDHAHSLEYRIAGHDADE